MNRAYVRTVAGLIVAWGALLSLLAPTGRTAPWSTALDFSQWATVSALPAGWRVRRDPRFPAVATTAFLDTASIALTVPEVDRALLKLKARFSNPQQLLQLQMNGAALAAIPPHVDGKVVRWSGIVPSEQLRQGANQLTLSNTRPADPIVIEKIEIGNIRRNYRAIGGMVLLDSRQADRWVPLPHPKFLLEGAGAAIAVAWLLPAIILLSRLPPWLPWAGLIFPLVVVLTAVGAVLGSAITPYTCVVKPSALLTVWLNAWWGGGLAVCGAVVYRGWQVLTGRRQILMQPIRDATRSALNAGGRAEGIAIASIHRFGTFSAGLVTQVWALAQTLTTRRWCRRMAALLVVLMAFASRALYYLQHSALPLSPINTGHDSEIYLLAAVRVAQQHPFLFGLCQPPHFPVAGVGNCPVMIGLVLGGFIHGWGIYPGIPYWVWTMVALSSLLCLTPYVWARLWGYSGAGGLAVGLLLATSSLTREMLPRVMTDLLGMLLLGGIFVLVARLAIRERWRDVIIASVGLTVSALTRTANTYLSLFLVLALGVGWVWTARDLRHCGQRLLRWGGLVALTLLWLRSIDAAMISGSWTHPYLPWIAFSHVRWATEYGPLHNSNPWPGLSQNVVSLVVTLWRDNPLWGILLLPSVGFGLWGLHRRRSPHALAYCLVLGPLAGYFIMLLPGSSEPRYALPWMLMQGLLIAQLAGIVWRQLCQRLPTRFWWGIAVTAGALIGWQPTAAVAQRMWSEWRQTVEAKHQATEYLAWVKPWLPSNAVIVVSHFVDPGFIAQHLDHQVVYAGSSNVYGLVIDPQRLAKHPFVPFDDGALLRAHPQLSWILSPTGRAIEHLLARGNTVWVLDPVVDPDSVPFFLRECGPGTLGFLPKGYFRLDTVHRAAAPRPWTLYQVMHAEPARRP